MPGQEIKKELTALENLKLDIEQYERMQDGVQELNGHVRTLKASFTTLLSILPFSNVFPPGRWTLTLKPS